MSPGEIVKLARLKKGWTQEDLAERIHVTSKTIQRIESGKVQPRAATLRVLSEVLQIDLKELLDLQEMALEEVDAPSVGSRILLNLSGLTLLILPSLVIWFWLKATYPSLKRDAMGVINFQINVLTLIIPCGIFSFLVLPVIPLVLVALAAWVLIFINSIRIGMEKKPLYPVVWNFLKSDF